MIRRLYVRRGRKGHAGRRQLAGLSLVFPGRALEPTAMPYMPESRRPSRAAGPFTAGRSLGPAAMPAIETVAAQLQAERNRGERHSGGQPPPVLGARPRQAQFRSERDRPDLVRESGQSVWHSSGTGCCRVLPPPSPVRSVLRMPPLAEALARARSRDRFVSGSSEHPLLMVARDTASKTHRTDAGDGARGPDSRTVVGAGGAGNCRQPCSRRWRSGASAWIRRSESCISATSCRRRWRRRRCLRISRAGVPRLKSTWNWFRSAETSNLSYGLSLPQVPIRHPPLDQVVSERVAGCARR